MTPVDTYAQMLRNEGLFVRPDDEGRLNFKYEGHEYAMLTYPNDPQYVGIGTTYALPAGVRRAAAMNEANSLTKGSKVAKVYVEPNRAVTISAELFVSEPENLAAVLLRLIRLVQSVSNELFSRFTAGDKGSV